MLPKKKNILKEYYRNKSFWSFAIQNHLEVIVSYIKFKNHKIIHRHIGYCTSKRIDLIKKLEISSKKFMDLIGKTNLSTWSCNNWGNWCPKYQNRQRTLEAYLTDPIYACFTMMVTFLTHILWFWFCYAYVTHLHPKIWVNGWFFLAIIS